jgi:hypothetical protein
MRTTLAAALAAALTALAIDATAANPSTQRADALFDEGTRLLEEGKYAEACPKLEESRRLAGGVGVTMYLAECRENTGKRVNAAALFREAEALARARQDKRADLARERAEKIEATLPKIVLQPAHADAEGLTIAIDGVAVESIAWGQPLPIDEGHHVVRATAHGMAPEERTFDATAGATTTLALAIERRATSSPPPREDSSRSLQRPIGIALGALGVVGVGLGAGFGVAAKSKLDASNAQGHCDASDKCDSTGLSLRSDALSAATISTVAFIVGAVALGGGAVVYFTAPSPRTASAGVSFAF